MQCENRRKHRRSGGGRNPGPSHVEELTFWIPAFAGMTMSHFHSNRSCGLRPHPEDDGNDHAATDAGSGSESFSTRCHFAAVS